jgi:GrpB-like predicted nucleotidyltransferase (UPF0157 family)
LEKFLKDFDIVIEHYGSTSIPNISAKPIIDIYVACKHADEVLDAVRVLAKNGYEVFERQSIPTTIGARTFDGMEIHTRVGVFESENFCDVISFRDYLRKSPKARADYEQAKHDAAQKVAQMFPNIPADTRLADGKTPLNHYREMKTETVTALNAEAKRGKAPY